MEIVIFHNTFGLLFLAPSAVGWILQSPFLSFLADSQASLWHILAPQCVPFGNQSQFPCKYKYLTFQNQISIYKRKKINKYLREQKSLELSVWQKVVFLKRHASQQSFKSSTYYENRGNHMKTCE